MGNIVSIAQRMCFNYGGEWSAWSKSFTTELFSEPKVKIYGDGSGVFLYNAGGREIFNLKISNYIPPTKQERKDHYKNSQWYEYEGTVDYYVNDKYPTAADLARANTIVSPNSRTDETPSVMRHAKATIKIAPYKDNPEVYNLWFDGVGMAVSIQGLHFEGQKRSKNKGRVAANIAQTVLMPFIGWLSWFYNPVYGD